MRTTVEIEDLLKSLELSKVLNPRKIKDPKITYSLSDLWYYLFANLNTRSVAAMQSFVRFGLVFGYGDSFVNEENGPQGLAIIGFSGNGKTTLVKNLCERSRMGEPFGADCLMLYKSPTDKGLKIFELPGSLLGKDWDDVVRKTIQYTETGRNYPLTSLIFIDEEGSNAGFGLWIQDGEPEDLHREYLFGIDANRQLLDGVDLIRYHNPNRQHSLEHMAESILTRLSTLK